MPRIPQYHIDGSVFVTGKQNPYANMARPRNLNDIISQILFNTAPQNPALPLIVNNGLTATSVSPTGTTLSMGGSLNSNTTVNGLGVYSLEYLNLQDHKITSNNYELDSDSVSIIIDGGAGQDPGDFLQATSGGNLQYSNFALPLTDGTSGQILVTDGNGQASWQTATGQITGADNGLNVQSSEVLLGGTLTQNTTVDGAGSYFLSLTDFTSSMLSSGTLTVNSPDMTVRSDDFKIITADVFSGTAQPGALLQLQAGGDSEFSTQTYPRNQADENRILVSDAGGAMQYQKMFESNVINIVPFNINLNSVTTDSVNNDQAKKYFVNSFDVKGWTIDSIALVTTNPTSTSGQSISFTLYNETQNINVITDTMYGNSFNFPVTSGIVLGNSDVMSFNIFYDTILEDCSALRGLTLTVTYKSI